MVLSSQITKWILITRISISVLKPKQMLLKQYFDLAWCFGFLLLHDWKEVKTKWELKK